MFAKSAPERALMDLARRLSDAQLAAVYTHFDRSAGPGVPVPAAVAMLERIAIGALAREPALAEA